MNLEELKDYLYENIPISSALGVDIVLANTTEVILKAPIKPNRNHKKTVFGGSLHSLATLASWCLVFVHLQKKQRRSELVISNSKIKYIRPVTADFEAVSTLNDKREWDAFEKGLAKWGKSKISVKAQIFQDNKLAVDYEGEFVAILSI